VKTVPNIPVVFSGSVPSGFVNDVKGWSFSKAEAVSNEGRLLTLDIDFGERCSLNCPWCFRKNGSVNSSQQPILSPDETLNVIRQGKELGLRTVKILGAGEPFEDIRFLQFLRELKKLGIWTSIFTKGHVLGSDELVRRYFSKSEGIRTAEELVEAVANLDVSILLSFQSFDGQVQDALVSSAGYTALRNRAIELLCSNGMNQPNPTRLSLEILPVTTMTISEVLEIYRWARERNMYPVVCPSMCSGRANDEGYRVAITPSAEALIDLYVRIYKYNISKEIQTLEQIRDEGVAAYAGGAPCTQVSCGMYVTSRGLVLRCPGDDVTIFGNVREKTLADIWSHSENCARRGVYNCKCPPKEGKTMPSCLYDEVLARISK
jgi:MoaA/NifB/PqqE/SkfB family radical SAM enzyme